MAQNRDIWVLLETEDGKVSRQSLALLSEGKELATEWGGGLKAIFIGPHINDIETTVGAKEAETVYQAQDDTLAQFDPFRFESILSTLMQERQPGLLLALSSTSGLDILPRLAAKMQLPLVTNCADIEVLEGGELQFVKPVHNGRLFANIACKGDGCKLATILPQTLTVSNDSASGPTKAELVSLDATTTDSPVKLTGFEKADYRTIDITEAQLIVAVGRGLGSRENFAEVETFADTVGAAIGGTRPMVDVGVLPYARQIGQTGKRVSPKLIMLFGISGAVEFTQGMRDAGTSIAVNNDPQAPILKTVDLGIVGDLHDVLPKLNNYVQKFGASESPNGGAGK